MDLFRTYGTVPSEKIPVTTHIPSRWDGVPQLPILDPSPKVLPNPILYGQGAHWPCLYRRSHSLHQSWIQACTPWRLLLPTATCSNPAPNM